MKKKEYHILCQELLFQYWNKRNQLAEAYLYELYSPLNIGDKVFDPKGSGALFEIEDVSACASDEDGKPCWLYRVKVLKGCKYASNNVIKDGPNIKLKPVITTATTIEEVYKIAKRQAKQSKKLYELAFADSYKINGVNLTGYQTRQALFNATDKELIDELERRKQIHKPNSHQI